MKRLKNFILLPMLISFFFWPQSGYPQKTQLEKQVIDTSISLSVDGERSRTIESLEFREVDIKDVLRQISKQYGLNIVFSEKVSGLVTVQLTNVSVEEALDSIITVNGFIYTKKENVIKVTTSEEAQQEGKQTKLFRLNNADALKLKDTLSKVLTAEGSIEADSRSNSIIVTDTLSVINKIELIIPSLDNPTYQVLIEAKLIETSLTKYDRLGIDWTTTLQATGASRPTTLPFPAKGDKDNGESFFPPGNLATATDFPSGYPYAFPAAAASKFAFGTLDASSLKSVFDFLKRRSSTRLIANPRVVATNNQKATIHVGKDIPLPTYERNETSGNMEITGWAEEKKVGVQLEVTPHISPDGHIKLSLRPEISSIDSWLQIEGLDAAPITLTRTVETEVMIKDGQTVVIGGLVKSDSSVTTKKIPILGDIPILGFFFNRKNIGASESSPAEKTDLLIFVTARIIKDTNEPLIAYETGLITTIPRPFKLDLRALKQAGGLK